MKPSATTDRGGRREQAVHRHTALDRRAMPVSSGFVIVAVDDRGASNDKISCHRVGTTWLHFADNVAISEGELIAKAVALGMLGGSGRVQ